MTGRGPARGECAFLYLAVLGACVPGLAAPADTGPGTGAVAWSIQSGAQPRRAGRCCRAWHAWGHAQAAQVFFRQQWGASPEGGCVPLQCRQVQDGRVSAGGGLEDPPRRAQEVSPADLPDQADGVIDDREPANVLDAEVVGDGHQVTAGVMTSRTSEGGMRS